VSDDNLRPDIQPGVDSQWHEAISKLMNELVATKRDLQQKTIELQGALDQVKLLNGLLPICASCKNIRDDKGYWQSVESYISNHSEAQFSHGICPVCVRKLYPEIADDILGKKTSGSSRQFK
jgi:hypothetical protein